jgi:hypothetical protein
VPLTARARQNPKADEALHRRLYAARGTPARRALCTTIFVRTLRTKGFARRVTIAFSVNVSTEIVAIHGVFYGGQDFEQLLRDTDSDD